MKLRLATNALRLRLSPEDLTALREGQDLEESVPFGPESKQVLRYTLVRSKTAASIQALFQDNEIVVHLPDVLAAAWLASREESLLAEQPIDQNTTLKLLIEKDRGRK